MFSKSLDLDVIPKYADYLKNKGIDAILVNGTTGEGMSMSRQERKLVAEKWFPETRRLNLTMMLQIGGTSSTDVFDLARHAETLGVEGVLVLPQLYKKPQTEEELVEYLGLVASFCPNTPLFYYHIPKYTNVQGKTTKYHTYFNRVKNFFFCYRTKKHLFQIY